MAAMKTKPTQKHRKIAIGTPLGDDVLLVQRVRMTEQLGRPFHIDMDLLSEDPNVDFNKIVGDNVTLRLQMQDDETRFFNAYVSEFAYVGYDGRFARYRATGRPWLWLLTRASDCRIFQNKTAVQIIEEVFKEHGFDQYELRLSGQYSELEYSVQYRETDFNYVSRLMEQYGIYYFVTHADGKHTLVLADSLSAHEELAGGCATLKYFPPQERGRHDSDFLWDWRVRKEVQSTKYILNDFDPLNPKGSLVANSMVSREHAASHFECYDYPGEYVKQTDGAELAKRRIEEIQARHEVCQSSGNARGMVVGGLFTLENAARQDQNRKYLVIGATHELFNDVFEAKGGSGDNAEEMYTCHATVIEENTPYRTPRTTPLPVIQGPQTAIVTGPSGEEIWTDEHGRVKVHFHWDLEGKPDEKSSCWVRVSQYWAGKKWGSMHLPRVGQEVIIEFLEGDPDRPIITGRVYNGESKPPYELPSLKNLSTIKSNSSKGGGGFNEIRMDDSKDEEQLFIHAQKQMDVRVRGSRYETVCGDRHLTVGGKKLEHIGCERHELVDTDHYEEIGGFSEKKIGSYDVTEIGSFRTLKVAESIDVQSMERYEKTDMKYHLKSGMEIVLEAGLSISLKAAGSFITIGPAGVDIVGPIVKINSGGSATAATAAGPLTALAPDKASAADNADPGEMAQIKRKQREKGKGKYGELPAPPYRPPGSDPPPVSPDEPPPQEKKTSWIEIKLVDEEGKDVPHEPVQVKLPDGALFRGRLDGNGFLRIDGIDPGTCEICFYQRDKTVWHRKGGGGGAGGGGGGGGGTGGGGGGAGGGGGP